MSDVIVTGKYYQIYNSNYLIFMNNFRYRGFPGDCAALLPDLRGALDRYSFLPCVGGVGKPLVMVDYLRRKPPASRSSGSTVKRAVPV